MSQPRLMPIVLVGGKSRRFGRDKLREPLPNGDRLVDRPIRALREAGLAPVTLVGRCAPEIRERGDHAIDDAYLDMGPIGGILHALEVFGCDIFVLAGDLPNVTSREVRAIVEASERAPEGLVVRARNEPCVAIYRVCLTRRIRHRLAAGELSLMHLVDSEKLVEIELASGSLRNVNTVGALNEAMENR